MMVIFLTNTRFWLLGYYRLKLWEATKVPALEGAKLNSREMNYVGMGILSIRNDALQSFNDALKNFQKFQEEDWKIMVELLRDEQMRKEQTS